MSCAFTFLCFQAGNERIIGLCPSVENSSCCYSAEPLLKKVRVTIFVKGFQIGVVRTAVFCVRPSTFEETVDVVSNAVFSFKADLYGTQWDNLSSVGKAQPMDLSHAEEEAQLQAAEHQRNISICCTCGSTKYLRLSCPLRQQRQYRPIQSPVSTRKLTSRRKTSNFSRRGLLNCNEQSFVEHLTDRGEQNVASNFVDSKTMLIYQLMNAAVPLCS